MEMNGNPADTTKENTMTDLTNALATRIATEDGLHFVHARNRVLLAIRIVEAATRIAAHNRSTGTAGFASDWPTTVADVLSRPGFVAEIVADLGVRTPSDDTLRLAVEIAA